jgi:hypothetical protein
MLGWFPFFLSQWCTCWRHGVANWEVASSIPDGVIGICNWHPSGLTVARGKVARCNCLGVWEPQPPGSLRECPSLNRDCLPCFTCTSILTLSLLMSYICGAPCKAMGYAVAQWLRHCATNRKIAGSIPDGVRIFYWPNPSGRTMALRSTQPLTDMSTRNVSWGGKNGDYAACLKYSVRIFVE